MKNYTYIDLFSGCGGLSLGLGKAGWQGLFGIEKSPMAFETFKYNLLGENSHFNWPDWLPCTNLDINEVLKGHAKKLESLRGKVDLIAGGPPCQGFSMAGKRNESDIRNSLVHSYLEFVDIIQPRVILFENVSGITQRFKQDDGSLGLRHSDAVAQQLVSLGYEEPVMRVLNFSEYGLPQSRRRFIMVAVRKGSNSSNAEAFFNQLDDNKCRFLRGLGLNLNTDVQGALSDLLRSHGSDQCPDGGRFQSGKYGKAQSSYQKLMRGNARKGGVPDSHRFPNHFPRTIQVFENVIKKAPANVGLRGDEAKKYGVKKRNVTLLAQDQPSPTILSIPDDYIHYSEARILTVRESARLQTFPDNFKFRGKYTSGGQLRKVEVPRYTQVGNAIPPLFAQQAGLSILKLLEVES